MTDIRIRHDVLLRAVLVAVALTATTVANAQSIRRTGGNVAERSARPFAVATPGPAAAAVPGTLVREGEPPRDGMLFMSERWMLFRDAAGAVLQVPVVKLFEDGSAPEWVLESHGRGADGRYTFAIPAWGTFHTERPGSVERLLRSRPNASILFVRSTLTLDPAAAVQYIDALTNGAFADSLYAIAGRPRTRAGLLSGEHRGAGDAAVYVVDRDSIALDPLTARSLEDLRGTFAHELGHRLQRQRPSFFTRFWHQVPPIDDPHVYGFGSAGEHQAEAFRFAVIYLQTTSHPDRDVTADTKLLELYESLMPGARATTLALLDEPVFLQHRMRDALIGSVRVPTRSPARR